MLIIAKSLHEIDFRALMDVYSEGNRENAEDFWPEMPDDQRIARAEKEFYQYLREDFFAQPGATYAIWKTGDIYVSALRMEPYGDGLLLEALETAPGHRRKGYAVSLIRAVQDRCGRTKIYSHVGKRNEASIQLHESCGFQRIAEYAVYADGSVNPRCCTMCYGGAAKYEYRSE